MTMADEPPNLLTNIEFDKVPEQPVISWNGDGELTLNYDGSVMSLGSITQGPQGPQGPPGEVIFERSDRGVRPAPAVRFEVDGWEYSFPTPEQARIVRDKLMKMTLEGEL